MRDSRGHPCILDPGLGWLLAEKTGGLLWWSPFVSDNRALGREGNGNFPLTCPPTVNARGGWGALNRGLGGGLQAGCLMLGDEAGASPRSHARGPFGPGEPPGSSGLDPGSGEGSASSAAAGSRPASGAPQTGEHPCLVLDAVYPPA